MTQTSSQKQRRGGQKKEKPDQTSASSRVRRSLMRSL
ncbi:hypothetical protein R3I93_006649 [Phoxinus phoxinus]|uniref:Uncharacterized protein n=1 Tax=Phoxinus phoxinus TaxID=58324 RepID=A0AAN9D6G9_9TELE